MFIEGYIVYTYNISGQLKVAFDNYNPNEQWIHLFTLLHIARTTYQEDVYLETGLRDYTDIIYMSGLLAGYRCCCCCLRPKLEHYNGITVSVLIADSQAFSLSAGA